MTSWPSGELRGAPRHLHAPPARSTAAEEAIDLAKSAGLVLDDWQQNVLRVALAERADGRWAAFEVALIVARQNGKGSVLEALELAHLFLFGSELILHSAHEFKTAAEAFRRVLGLVQSTRDLERLVAKVHTAHGNEGIELRSGQRLRFVARTGGSGRGFSGDLVVLDEAYNLSSNSMAALLPTLSARPNPQLWYTSSAPLVEASSAVLRKLCKRGRAGVSDRLAYMEFCAAEGAALDDRQAWADANPGLGVRISEESIANEVAALEPDDFARERLGLWIDPEDAGDQVLPAADWAACEDLRSGPTGRLAFALDVSIDRRSASFAVAGEGKRGGTHLEVADHRPGTDWLVRRAKELQSQWGGVLAVAGASPAASLKPDLEAEGVEVLEVPTQDHARACGGLFDDVVQRQIRHLGQGPLNAAVAGAKKRDYGDAWLWSRKGSSVDISPLVAVTLARWALTQVPEQPKPVFAY